MASKVPATLKALAAYVKIANEHATRDPVVYYWCLMYSAQKAMELDSKSPDALQFIKGLLSTLETIKGQLKGMDAVTNETIAQAHLENFALKLFGFADNKEKAGQVDNKVVHAFYTAGHIMDVLTLFGELDEQMAASRKYAKWKATQIFACLKDGTPYVSSSQQQEANTRDELADLANFASGGSNLSHSANQSDNSNFAPYPPNPQFGFGQPPAPTHSGSSSSLSSGQGPAPMAPPPHRPSPPTHSAMHLPPNPLSETSSAPALATGTPSAAEFAETKKYIKFAMSALDYEDAKSIVDNLNKALAVMGKYVR